MHINGQAPMTTLLEHVYVIRRADLPWSDFASVLPDRFTFSSYVPTETKVYKIIE